MRLQHWANIGIKIATALSQSFFAARAGSPFTSADPKLNHYTRQGFRRGTELNAFVCGKLNLQNRPTHTF